MRHSRIFAPHMLKQHLSLRLQQKLSPQQIQMMKLLQVPTVELEQRIKQEIEENPALEEGELQDEEDQITEEQAINESQDADGNEENERDDFDMSDYFQDDDTPDYKLNVSNTGPDEEDREMPLSGGTTFQENMRAQLSLRRIDDRTEMLAEQLIGNLDEDGYLRRDLDAIVNDLAFSQNVMCEKEELAAALKVLQSLDPGGVGAKDLRECLLLQVDRMPHSLEQRVAHEILNKHFEAFSKKHYQKILDKLEIDEEALKDAIDLIVHLNPQAWKYQPRYQQTGAGDHPGFRRDVHRWCTGPYTERTQCPRTSREPGVPRHDQGVQSKQEGQGPARSTSVHQAETRFGQVVH